MKFTVNREILLPPLQQIVNVIEKRQTMPILANVLLDIQQDSLTLTGTDLEIQLVAKIGIEAPAKGAITLPAKKFLDICRLLPAGVDIKLELMDDHKIKIVAARSRFTLNCLPAENYPEFAHLQFEHEFSMDAGKLKKAFDKTLFCMASQDVRYYLNGLLLSVSNNTLKLVASDGHRLSIYQDPLDEALGFEARIILPRKGVMELNRLLDDPDASLHLAFSSNHIRIHIKNLVFSAKLVDAKYPDFSKVFQQSFLNEIRIPKQVFKEALTRVAVLSNEKFKGIGLDIEPGNLRLSTHNPEHDEAEEEVLIEYTGDPINIAFNAQYLLDAVGNLDSELAILTLASNLGSCFINEPNGEVYKFIIMPMRL